MKRAFLSFCICLATLLCLAQGRNAVLTASLANYDRVELLKNSLDINPWHERSFWPMYQKYVDEINEVSNASHRLLEHFTSIRPSTSEEESRDMTEGLLKSRNTMLEVLSSYYGDIAGSFNGVIALQFLQNEILLEMMQEAALYEKSYWKDYRFHPTSMNFTQFTTAKRNTIAKALRLTKEEAEIFWQLYSAYERECDALLGVSYDVVGLFAINPSDFTPGLAKRMGNDLINLLYREAKLKERYYLRMKDKLGANLAGRFIAWEDYYSLVNKMYAWADAP